MIKSLARNTVRNLQDLCMCNARKLSNSTALITYDTYTHTYLYEFICLRINGLMQRVIIE